MASKNYRNVNYFESRPDIVKVFDDLEKFHDFCRFELLPFSPSDLYNRDSAVWNQFYQYNRPRKLRTEWNNNRNSNGGGYNRAGGSRNFSR